jgi:1-aminocyclopropane-1-carboxylate synthase
MLEATNVNVTPGQMMHCGEAGWFRVCFASQPPEVLSVALQRLMVFLSSLPRAH